MPRPLLPPWLRRGLEAAVVAAVVAIAALAGSSLAAGSGPYPVPAGPTGALLLAPPVLALAVVTAAYPLAMSATRGDALFGAFAAFLVAADLVVLLAGGPVRLEVRAFEANGGLIAALIAAGPAAVGVVAAQLLTPHGFGRRAGAIAAVSAAVAALAVVVVVTTVA